ncbi:lasso peptide biosynthesis PqqD family chaperone [Streptomyces chrestomyceticus]|uniref:lasso peptide biosynthesis PqqD family chaperone n=1 Tax=Streptomyces chrestomyceticus TaxID=68185 RepID=UPI0035A89279
MNTITLHPHVTCVPCGDGMTLLDERSGRYWQINATGALIVRQLLDGATPQQAAAALAAKYPGATHADDDVEQLIASLREKHLLADA